MVSKPKRYSHCVHYYCCCCICCCCQKHTNGAISYDFRCPLGRRRGRRRGRRCQPKTHMKYSLVQNVIHDAEYVHCASTCEFGDRAAVRQTRKRLTDPCKRAQGHVDNMCFGLCSVLFTQQIFITRAHTAIASDARYIHSFGRATEQRTKNIQFMRNYLLIDRWNAFTRETGFSLAKKLILAFEKMRDHHL